MNNWHIGALLSRCLFRSVDLIAHGSRIRHACDKGQQGSKLGPKEGDIPDAEEQERFTLLGQAFTAPTSMDVHGRGDV